MKKKILLSLLFLSVSVNSINADSNKISKNIFTKLQKKKDLTLNGSSFLKMSFSNQSRRLNRGQRIQNFQPFFFDLINRLNQRKSVDMLVPVVAPLTTQTSAIVNLISLAVPVVDATPTASTSVVTRHVKTVPAAASPAVPVVDAMSFSNQSQRLNRGQRIQNFQPFFSDLINRLNQRKSVDMLVPVVAPLTTQTLAIVNLISLAVPVVDATPTASTSVVTRHVKTVPAAASPAVPVVDATPTASTSVVTRHVKTVPAAASPAVPVVEGTPAVAASTSVVTRHVKTVPALTSPAVSVVEGTPAVAASTSVVTRHVKTVPAAASPEVPVVEATPTVSTSVVTRHVKTVPAAASPAVPVVEGTPAVAASTSVVTRHVKTVPALTSPAVSVVEGTPAVAASTSVVTRHVKTVPAAPSSSSKSKVSILRNTFEPKTDLAKQGSNRLKDKKSETSIYTSKTKRSQNKNNESVEHGSHAAVLPESVVTRHVKTVPALTSPAVSVVEGTPAVAASTSVVTRHVKTVPAAASPEVPVVEATPTVSTSVVVTPPVETVPAATLFGDVVGAPSASAPPPPPPMPTPGRKGPRLQTTPTFDASSSTGTNSSTSSTSHTRPSVEQNSLRSRLLESLTEGGRLKPVNPDDERSKKALPKSNKPKTFQDILNDKIAHNENQAKDNATEEDDKEWEWEWEYDNDNPAHGRTTIGTPSTTNTTPIILKEKTPEKLEADRLKADRLKAREKTVEELEAEALKAEASKAAAKILSDRLTAMRKHISDDSDSEDEWSD